MSGFEQLENEFTAALARRRAQGVSSQTPRQRRTRRGLFGLAMIFAAGSVGSGAVAVAGGDPWAFLRGSENLEPNRASVVASSGSVTAASDPGTSPAWKVRAYQTVGGSVCLTGGFVGSVVVRNSCESSATVINRLAGVDPAGVHAVLAPVESRGGEREALLYGLAAPDVKRVEVAGLRSVVIRPTAQTMTATLDRTQTVGLSPEALAKLRALPDSLVLHPFAAVVRLNDTDADADRATLAFERRDGGSVHLAVSTGSHRGVADNADEVAGFPTPVTSASAAQSLAIPELSRAQQPTDRLTAPLDAELLRHGAQKDLGRELTVVGNSDDLRVWALPGDGRLCLQGSTSDLTTCIPEARLEQASLTGVVCSEALDPHQRLVWGLAPPGTDAIRVTYVNGDVRDLPAGRLLALFADRSKPTLREVAWHLDGAWNSRPSPLPGDAGSDQCR